MCMQIKCACLETFIARACWQSHAWNACVYHAFLCKLKFSNTCGLAHFQKHMSSKMAASCIRGSMNVRTWACMLKDWLLFRLFTLPAGRAWGLYMGVSARIAHVYICVCVCYYMIHISYILVTNPAWASDVSIWCPQSTQYGEKMQSASLHFSERHCVADLDIAGKSHVTLLASFRSSCTSFWHKALCVTLSFPNAVRFRKQFGSERIRGKLFQTAPKQAQKDKSCYAWSNRWARLIQTVLVDISDWVKVSRVSIWMTSMAWSKTLLSLWLKIQQHIHNIERSSCTNPNLIYAA